MRNIKLTVAYDGAAFHGWQIQPGLPTIQGLLADVAQQITQEKILVFGASRTDAGVHALGQVAHFRTHSALTAEDFRRGLNALLPPQIRIMAAEEVGPDFHSRWQSLAKTYRYRIFRGRTLPPFEHGRMLHYPWPLDEKAMEEAARLFEGTHDFASFAASSDSEDGDKDRETVREIFCSKIVRHAYSFFGSPPNGLGAAGASQPESVFGAAPAARHPESSFGAAAEEGPSELEYVVYGRSFLRYMVRKIVGTLLDVGKGKLAPADLAAIFDARDRSRSGPTVPPDGLYLVSLEYPDPTDSLAHERRGSQAKIG
jgi:tRNA pseudouridine38-40 synthase